MKLYLGVSWLRLIGRLSLKQRRKIALQHHFQFMHEQSPLRLLCMEQQWEDSFKEIQTYGRAEDALGLRELRCTSLKEFLKARLDLFL